MSKNSKTQGIIHDLMSFKMHYSHAPNTHYFQDPIFLCNSMNFYSTPDIIPMKSKNNSKKRETLKEYLDKELVEAFLLKCSKTRKSFTEFLNEVKSEHNYSIINWRIPRWNIINYDEKQKPSPRPSRQLTNSASHDWTISSTSIA